MFGIDWEGPNAPSLNESNVMTLPYGGSAYGLGQQIIDDARKHNIDELLFMENAWGAFLGRETHEGCRTALKKPMQLLKLFEASGKKAEKTGEFLSWYTPIVNFPVVQYYVEGIVKKTYVHYGPTEGRMKSSGYYSNTLQLRVCFIEEETAAKGRQSQGAAPNMIHSLDATHLILTINGADFAVSTVHDSYGCLPGEMEDLFRIVREEFVTLYDNNPLGYMLKQIGASQKGLQMGSLDIKATLESEYCFS